MHVQTLYWNCLRSFRNSEFPSSRDHHTSYQVRITFHLHVTITRTMSETPSIFTRPSHIVPNQNHLPSSSDHCTSRQEKIIYTRPSHIVPRQNHLPSSHDHHTSCQGRITFHLQATITHRAKSELPSVFTWLLHIVPSQSHLPSSRDHHTSCQSPNRFPSQRAHLRRFCLGWLSWQTRMI